MSWLSNFLKKKENEVTSTINNSESHTKWEGYELFEMGKQCYINGQANEALNYFDLAVENGFEENFKFDTWKLYDMRAACLQELEYHYDAIKDFNKTISLSPGDCNKYFSRSISKGAILDFEGEIADLMRAIELSKENTEQNRVYNNAAKKMGHSSATGMYQFSLIRAEMELKSETREKERILNAPPERKEEMEKMAQEWKDRRLQGVKKRT